MDIEENKEWTWDELHEIFNEKIRDHKIHPNALSENEMKFNSCLSQKLGAAWYSPKLFRVTKSQFLSALRETIKSN